MIWIAATLFFIVCLCTWSAVTVARHYDDDEEED